VFRVSSTEATSVTATAMATGLTVTGAGVPQPGTTTGGSIRLGVMATTPGMHCLAVTLSAPGATPVQVTLPYVLASATGVVQVGGCIVAGSSATVWPPTARGVHRGRAAHLRRERDPARGHLALPGTEVGKASRPHR
jgi:hypothetical protein